MPGEKITIHVKLCVPVGLFGRVDMVVLVFLVQGKEINKLFSQKLFLFLHCISDHVPKIWKCGTLNYPVNRSYPWPSRRLVEILCHAVPLLFDPFIVTGSDLSNQSSVCVRHRRIKSVSGGPKEPHRLGLACVLLNFHLCLTHSRQILVPSHWQPPCFYKPLQ